VELIQGQTLRSRIDLSLNLGRALLFTWASNEVDEDDQLAKADTKRFNEHGESLTVRMKKGAQLT
jgi:hypothetical protein